jgi:phenylacetate-CoA ligase
MVAEGGGRPDASVDASGAHACARLDREALGAHQGGRLSALLARIAGRNAFYTRKLAGAGLDPSALAFPEDLGRLPLTTKAELIADQESTPPWGTALTDPLVRYTRYCQTSSTTGRPMKWIDTNDSWQWLLDCWKEVFRAAQVRPGDRVFFPFSFGPFLGFWAGFEAGPQLGLQCVPGGGMSSHVRLGMIEAVQATVVCCTPTYALRLAEIAAQDWPERRLADSSVRILIVAGEPGGSIAATRQRIEESWGARVIDHHGLTEVGPVSFECWEAPGGLHVNEGEFIAEVLDSATQQPVPDGQPGELVVTNLGRTASPVIRYRTGDIVVRSTASCACGRTWMRLDGGILARADDMVNIRGVNVYPVGIESVVRRFSEVVEFRSVVSRTSALRSLRLEIEVRAGLADSENVAHRVAAELRQAIGLTVPVQIVEQDSLPRFEMKSSRFVVEA